MRVLLVVILLSGWAVAGVLALTRNGVTGNSAAGSVTTTAPNSAVGGGEASASGSPSTSGGPSTVAKIMTDCSVDATYRLPRARFLVTNAADAPQYVYLSVGFSDAGVQLSVGSDFETVPPHGKAVVAISDGTTWTGKDKPVCQVLAFHVTPAG